MHRGDARRCRRAWLIRVLRTSVQELENRTAFDESATHDDAQWERFMQQVTDLTRLARHHPETMNVDQIHVHVLPHIAKCASHTRTTLASTTIECLGQLAKLDISKALRIQWIAHIVPALLSVAGDRGCRKVLLRHAASVLTAVCCDPTSAPLALKPLVTYASKNITGEQKALRKAAAGALRDTVEAMNAREGPWAEREAAVLPDLLELLHGLSSDAIGETRTLSKAVLVSLHGKFETELEEVLAQKISIDHQAPCSLLLCARNGAIRSTVRTCYDLRHSLESAGAIAGHPRPRCTHLREDPCQDPRDPCIPHPWHQDPTPVELPPLGDPRHSLRDPPEGLAEAFPRVAAPIMHPARDAQEGDPRGQPGHPTPLHTTPEPHPTPHPEPPRLSGPVPGLREAPSLHRTPCDPDPGARGRGIPASHERHASGQEPAALVHDADQRIGPKNEEKSPGVPRGGGQGEDQVSRA